MIISASLRQINHHIHTKKLNQQHICLQELQEMLPDNHKHRAQEINTQPDRVYRTSGHAMNFGLVFELKTLFRALTLQVSLY